MQTPMPLWIVGLPAWTLLGMGLLLLLQIAATAWMKTLVAAFAKASVRQKEWGDQFDRILQKTRGVERQELRFRSYGALWKQLRPLAIYDPTEIDRNAVAVLFKGLTDWYFSERGGLFLTPQARDFYFALQDLLRVSANVATDWRADRFKELEGAADLTFRDLLRTRGASEAIAVLDYFAESTFDDWQERAAKLGKTWRKAIRDLAPAWNELNEQQRFATLQQVGSKLRTSLAIDLESRSR